VDILRAILAAEASSNSTPGIEIYDAAMKRYTARDDLMNLQRALFILGQPQRAMAVCRQIRQTAPPLSKIWRPFSETCDKYVCGEISDEELIQLAKNSRTDQSTAFYAIALRRLGEGDRAEARACFQKAAAFPVSGWDYHDFSWACLKRMEMDPNWPPWIPAHSAK
jgi:hypothetical protein